MLKTRPYRNGANGYGCNNNNKIQYQGCKTTNN